MMRCHANLVPLTRPCSHQSFKIPQLINMLIWRQVIGRVPGVLKMTGRGSDKDKAMFGEQASSPEYFLYSISCSCPIGSSL